MTRSAAARELALSLGAASVTGASGSPPGHLDSAILFAPAGDLVPVAMRALDRGGILSVAGIHLTEVPALVYERELFYEKEIRTVTANTRADGEEFLRLAAALRVRPHVHTHPLDDAQQVLRDLAADSYTGAAVLVPT